MVGLVRKGATVSEKAMRTAPLSAAELEEARCEDIVARYPDDFIARLMVVDTSTRAKHVRLLQLFICLTSALILSLGVNAYQVTNPLDVVLVGSRPVEDGNAIIHTLNQPINTDEAVRAWVTSAVVAAYTFDFALWDAQLGSTRENFTPEGWRSFYDAMKDTGVLDAVIRQKFRITAIPNGATVMAKLPVQGGPDKLEFDVPIVVTYEGQGAHPSTALVVSATVVAQPPWRQIRGLGISQLTLGGGLVAASAK